MSFDEGLLAWVQEALEPLGHVSFRRMMGGATLYLDGTIFAILDEGEIWFKADEESNAIWDAEGCASDSRSRSRTARSTRMNYRRGPTDVYDDADAMRHWADARRSKPGARRPVKRRKAKE